MADETETTTDRESVPVSNVGYAAVPEGFVFVPTVTGDGELLKKLLDAVEDPEDLITRAGYGYVVPKDAAVAAGVETQDVVQVIDPSTPDTTPAEHALDTQDSPITTATDAEVEAAQDGPLELRADDPARNPDDEAAADEAPADVDADKAATNSTTTSKKSSAAPAAS